MATAIPFEVIMESTAIDPTSFVAKCLKVLRLFKLARLVRLRRILQRWLARSTIDLSVLELIKFAVMTVVMAHWLACMWGFAGRHYSDNTPIDLDEWYVEDYRALSWVQKHQFTLARPFQLYGVALYVALSNIFGGPCEVSPANYYEFYLQGFMMLIGSSLWAYIIGSGCGIVATLHPEAEEHRRVIGQLNYFISDRECSRELATRLRTYFNETSRARYYREQDADLLRMMTNELRGDTSLSNAHTLFVRVPYLPTHPLSAPSSRASPALTTAIYCPREQVASDELTVITHGLVAKHGRIGARVLGLDIVLNVVALRDTVPAMTLTFVQTASLTREALDELLVGHPCAIAAVRRFRFKLTFQRAVLATAAFARAAPRHAGSATVVGRQHLSLASAFDLAREAFAPTAAPDINLPPTPQEARVVQLDRKVDALRERLEARMDALLHAVQRASHTSSPLVQSTASTPVSTSAERIDMSRAVWGTQMRAASKHQVDPRTAELTASPSDPSKGKPPAQLNRRRHRHASSTGPAVDLSPAIEARREPRGPAAAEVDPGGPPNAAGGVVEQQQQQPSSPAPYQHDHHRHRRRTQRPAAPPSAGASQQGSQRFGTAALVGEPDHAVRIRAPDGASQEDDQVPGGSFKFKA